MPLLGLDVQEEDAVMSAPREHGAVYTGIGHAEGRVVPHDRDLDRAAKVLEGPQ